MLGKLYVLEGPDGVGKTTLASRLAVSLAKRGQPAQVLAFPGRDRGTLGHLIWRLHHKPAEVGVEQLHPTSLQLLHVASHIDLIELHIRPLLISGTNVILDRFWWSTWVYGVEAGIDPWVLRTMISIEEYYWGEIMPARVFLIDRDPLGITPGEAAQHKHRRDAYRQLASSSNFPVEPVANGGLVEDALSTMVNAVAADLPT